MANTTLFGVASSTTWYGLGVSSQNPGRITSNVDGVEIWCLKPPEEV